MSPRSLGASAFLHALLALLVVFGLPHVLNPEDILYQPQVIAVDLKLAPVANAPNRMPTPPKKPEPEAKKPTPPAPKPEPIKKEEPKKEEPKKPEPKKEEPKKAEPKKQPDKKAEKKEEPKKKDDAKEPTLDDILKSIESPAAKPSEPSAPAEKGSDIKSDVPYDPNMPLSQTVSDSIRNQIMKCWNYQGGAMNQASLKAHIQVVFREDGSIIEAKLRASDQMRYNSDSAFRSLVDSARRATRDPSCVPLKGLPVSDYPSWSKVELVFDPEDMW